MHEKAMPDPTAIDGTKLWDEILKAIVSTMPSQLFPLFKEIYGKEYSKETSIVVLGSETSSFQEDKDKPHGSTLMDIALLVAGTDYYHLECQMKNDSEMVIRMFAYDVRFGITHSNTIDKDTEEVILQFPCSAVLYPEKNSAIPDHLKCRVIFQDNSEHIYRIPTVKIQAYSLKEIKEKHLTLFIPYTILRLRPLLKKNRKHPLTQKELTELVEEVILVLKEELSDGYLTEAEYNDYIRLFRFAADRVLRQYPQMREEVRQVTEPLIKLPSMIIKEQQKEIADQKEQIAHQEEQIAYQKMVIDGKDTELQSKEAEINRLQKLVDQLSSDRDMP